MVSIPFTPGRKEYMETAQGFSGSVLLSLTDHSPARIRLSPAWTNDQGIQPSHAFPRTSSYLLSRLLSSATQLRSGVLVPYSPILGEGALDGLPSGTVLLCLRNGVLGGFRTAPLNYGRSIRFAWILGSVIARCASVGPLAGSCSWYREIGGCAAGRFDGHRDGLGGRRVRDKWSGLVSTELELLCWQQ